MPISSRPTDGSGTGSRPRRAAASTTPPPPVRRTRRGHVPPGFLGSYNNVKTITELGFASHQAYAKAFNAAVDAYARAGSILSDEASEMRRRARLCPPLTYTETYRDHYGRFVALTPC